MISAPPISHPCGHCGLSFGNSASLYQHRMEWVWKLFHMAYQKKRESSSPLPPSLRASLPDNRLLLRPHTLCSLFDFKIVERPLHLSRASSKRIPHEFKAHVLCCNHVKVHHKKATLPWPVVEGVPQADGKITHPEAMRLRREKRFEKPVDRAGVVPPSGQEASQADLAAQAASNRWIVLKFPEPPSQASSSPSYAPPAQALPAAVQPPASGPPSSPISQRPFQSLS